MKISILVILVLLISCAQQQVDQRKAEMEASLNPLMNQSEEAVILQLGQPQSVEQISGIKIFKYRRSFGQRSTAAVYNNPYAPMANVSGQSWETYDEYNIYFQNGIAVKWDGYVQR